MDWKVDFDELIPFLGRTIYRAENVLVELCANSYDADAEIVEVTSRGEAQQIILKDDGCGMDSDDLDELITIAKSKKKGMLERGETTPKFHRKLLGSFGIGIISFFSIGDFIRIFTRKEGNEPLFLEIKKVFSEEKGRQIIDISELDEREEYAQHLVNTAHGTTIELNNKNLNFTDYYDVIKNKLSNLPLSDNFKIKLQNLEVKRDDFDESIWFKREFQFTLDNIDPSYESQCSINVNHETPIEAYKRGVYPVVNGRVIERDLYSEIYPELSSPGTIVARVRGFIQADYLEKAIQANREDFFDTEIIAEIKERIKEPLNQVITSYLERKDTWEKEQKYTELLQRVESAKNKFAAPNKYLKYFGINFSSNPEFEQEVVLIIAQLCQKGLLPFQILDYNSGSHIDCVVKWPLTQDKRDPDFVKELEIETSLDHFFDHQHDFRVKPDICCWEIKPADLERKKAKYKENRLGIVEDIQLKEGVDKEHYGHQKELHFTVRDTYDELRTIILRVYVLSEYLESLYEREKKKAEAK